MIRLARQRREVEGKLEFRAWNGQMLPFPDRTFDSVVVTFAFYRFPDPLVALREMWRVLHPGSDIYVLEPDRSSFGGLYKLWDTYFRITDPGHVRYYSSVSLIGLLKQACFGNVREVRRFERFMRGGKLLATAIVLAAERPGEAGYGARRPAP
jgi:ubiquinone/menaquinone biosynthesis C-methylase UbiE